MMIPSRFLIDDYDRHHIAGYSSPPGRSMENATTMRLEKRDQLQRWPLFLGAPGMGADFRVTA